MKVYLTGILASFLACTSAHAAVQTWKANHTIYYFVQPTLHIRVQSLHVAEDAWERVDLSLALDGDNAAAAADLEAANPGFHAERALPSLDRPGTYTLRIPSLGIEDRFAPKFSEDGILLDTMELLSKKDAEKFEASLASSTGAVSIEGKVSLVLPQSVPKERASFPASICSRFGHGQAELFQVLLAYPGVDQEIQRAASDSENQQSLRSQILKSCFATAAGTSLEIRSAAELFATPLLISEPASDFSSSTYQWENRKTDLPLGFESRVERGIAP